MRTLSWQEVDDILNGATVLGCGGGGDYEEGRELMRRAYDEGRAVRLAAPDELPDDAVICCPYGVGGLTQGDEAVYDGLERPAEYPGVLAVQALGEHLGVEFAALITGELGGWSIADAFYPAAMLDLPVVDADPVGRAVPELQHSLFKVHGLPIAPQAVTNEVGDTVIVTRVAGDARAEALVRALAVASRNLVCVADHALPWGQVRPAVISGSREPRAACGRGAPARAGARGGRGRGGRGRLRRPRRLPRPRRLLRRGRSATGSRGESWSSPATPRTPAPRTASGPRTRTCWPGATALRTSCLRISSAVSRESRASRSPIRITRQASASTWWACPRRRSGARLPVSRSSGRVTSGSTSTSYRWRSGSPGVASSPASGRPDTAPAPDGYNRAMEDAS